MSVVVSRKKRLFKILGVAFLVVAASALALPAWFPWILRPVLARFGVGFDSYERVGYARFALTNVRGQFGDRKSTRLNSSHLVISYAVFCLKKKKQYYVP